MTPRRVGPADIARAAAANGLEAAVVQAVLTVETGGAGGFLADGRLRLLEERHVFSRRTGRRWDATHPGISGQPWDRRFYVGGAGEWPRFEEAAALDRDAALCSCSWGLAQIMGFNHAACGYPSAAAFVAAMATGEGPQLDAFFALLRSQGLLRFLRVRDFPGFTALYNGPGQVALYSAKLAAAHADAAGAAQPDNPIAGMLRIGMRGDAVRRLQLALNRATNRPPVLVDGVYGRVTEIAVAQFQEARGLEADGVVGPITAQALGL